MQLCPRKQDLVSMLQLQLKVCSIMLQMLHCISKQLFYLSSPSQTIPDCKTSCNSVQGNRTYSVCCDSPSMLQLCSSMKQYAATWYILYLELFLSTRRQKQFPLQKSDKISAHFPNFCFIVEIAMLLQLLQHQKTNFCSANMFQRSFQEKTKTNGWCKNKQCSRWRCDRKTVGGGPSEALPPTRVN